MNRTRTALMVLALPLFLVASTPLHLDLVDSFPKEDQVLSESPTEMWLKFSVQPDMEQTSFSVRGADARVELGEIVVGESPEIIHAVVEGELAAGEYTLSWVGAPMDDHAVRGRFTFTVQAQR